jgi:PAS domain S-box-containing protein
VSDEQIRRLGRAVLDESAEELYEHAPCGYLSCLPDGTIVRVNQTLLDWTGYTRDYLLSDTRVQSLLSVGSKIYYETHFAPLLQMQGRANEIALEIVGADRTARPILVNAVQKRDAEGTPLFMRMTLFDATDRRRYERELLVARRRAEQIAADKADLLAMLSHDIRNPLNALMGNVFMLERSNLPEAHMRRLRVVRTSSENMLALLNRVLELSKAESAAFALAESSFALAPLVRDAAGAFAARAEEKGLRLDVTIAADVPETVIGDPIALRQILSNFIGNAVKFTERGSVSVSVRALEPATDAVTLKFMVIDTGIGIPADRVERIFEEFTQGSDDTAARYGGSGLGLAIARKLLALYGSSIQVESAPGEGSAFSFKLRLAVPRS